MLDSSREAVEPVLAPPRDEYTVMVLLVDDQPIIGEAIRRMLADMADIDFHYCADAGEAVRFAERIGPTVILQDLVLPGIDGLSLVRAYRTNAATRDIPLIVLSTKEEPTVKSEAFLAGANDYLVKLPDPIELIARIRYHSRAYLNQIQRDEAYRALRKSQNQLLETNLELQRLNNIDGLTGLGNKKCFNKYLEAEWRRAVREQNELSALMIDVDDFKRYNDTYGHLAGDEVLEKIASAITDVCRRPADLAARFGGEEFVVLLPATSAAGARHIAEKLRSKVADLSLPHEAATVGAFVTVSLGGATMTPQPGSDPFHLLQVADTALYAAKRAGKNRVAMAE